MEMFSVFKVILLFSKFDFFTIILKILSENFTKCNCGTNWHKSPKDDYDF